MQKLIIFINIGFIINLTSGIPFENRDASSEVISHIVGGVDATKGTGHHMASLVVGDIFLVCGGVIVTLTRIMTAAHCLDSVMTWNGLHPTFRGIIGTHTWHDDRNYVNFTGYAIHPDWNTRLIKYDLGFIFVRGEIPLGPKVAIIPISLSFVDGGVASSVSGWGLDETGTTPSMLQVLSTETLSPTDCAQRMANLQVGIPYDPNVEICTWHSVGHGNCYGDSGSALYDEKTGCLIGIVSWGIPCARDGPDVYARPSNMADFIISILGLNNVHYCN